MQRVHQAASGLAQAERLFQVLHKAHEADPYNFHMEQALKAAKAHRSRLGRWLSWPTSILR